jgi:hypothetical protein
MKRKFILTSLALTFCMGMYAEQPVTVETDSMRRIDLEEVMIHATKTGALLKDLPNRVEVVTKRQIEASGINNLTDLLKNFVNVDVIEYPGYNSYFSIRGFKPTEGCKDIDFFILRRYFYDIFQFFRQTATIFLQEICISSHRGAIDCSMVYARFCSVNDSFRGYHGEVYQSFYRCRIQNHFRTGNDKGSADRLSERSVGR